MTYVKHSLLLMGAVALSACAGGQAGETFENNQNAIIGTGLGAAAGAVLGRIVSSDDDPDEAQKIGIVLGAGAGALLGSQLDKQERALKQQMAGTGATVQNTGQSLNVTLPEAITFATNSATVNPSFIGPLQQLAGNLNQFPNSVVSVVGHTDNTGGVAFNQQLSEQRARSVASILIGNGVNSGRISTRGEGEFSPIASNGSAAGRQQNRRVVVTITPTQGG